MENVPAAQYLRVSTEHQEYSLDFQTAEIATYARNHSFVVCQTYLDEARSGLVIRRRDGLSRLLQDVVGGRNSYRAILVYDVSRWGRFQDPDEAAHYEFLCKTAGVRVHYCAEHFRNDGYLPNVILKTLKRVMAGEYSRELSQRVFAGLIQLVRRGFHTGGPPGYGLRRMLVSSEGVPKQLLEAGQYKGLQSDRVLLVAGPPEEVFWIREIYRLFVEERKTFTGIAAQLEKQCAPFLPGTRWSDHAVKTILTHPKYNGTAVFNRTTARLCSKWRRLPESEWIVVPNAFEQIVAPEIFEAAQKTLQEKFWNHSNEEVLGQLRSIFAIHGRLSHLILKQHGLSGSTIAHRFGSLIKAYELVGYHSPHEKTAGHRLQVRKFRADLMNRLMEMFPGRVSIHVWTYKRRDCLRLRNGLRIAVRVCRSIHLARKGRMWVLQAAKEEYCRVTLMAGMNPENTAIEAFYVAGRLSNHSKLHITEDTDWLKNAVRLRELNSLLNVISAREWE